MREPDIRRELTDWVDPERLHATLAATYDNTVWLDAGPHATDGFSYLAAVTQPVVGADGLDEMAAQIAAGVRESADSFGADDSTGPFRLGWVGWFGYEFGAGLVGVAGARSRYPDVALGLVESMLCFDHGTRRVTIVARDAHLADQLQNLVAPAMRDEAHAPGGSAHESTTVSAAPSWRHDGSRYRALVEQCKRAIHDGDAYQLCLTNEILLAGSFNPVSVYHRLRYDNPSHHGALIRLDGVSLLSSSPEVFLRVTGDGRVTTMPIKGTRRRGVTSEEDRSLASELKQSHKEQAENLMIVDLMRNDLSRVATLGSVRAENLLEVQSLPHVHQLVSTVSAQLKPGFTALDALRASFPAGSMTGAPKIAAMKILSALEQGPRGIYSGAFGWLGLDGTCELAMVIRSIVIDAQGASIGTGGGITSDSDAAFELDETHIKAAAALRALGAR